MQRTIRGTLGWLFIVSFFLSPSIMCYAAPAIGSRSTPTLTGRQRSAIQLLRRTICERLAECRPEMLSKKECRNKLLDDDPFVQTLPPGVFGADPKAIKVCVQGIKRASCEVFFGSTPPAGCEFFR